MRFAKNNDDGSMYYGTDSEAETYTGGFIGYSQGINFENIDTSCTVSGHDNVGGIAGFNYNGEIKNVKYRGTLTATGENAGGIVGCNNGEDNKGNIKNSYNYGNITGKQNTGGIVGISYGGWIDYCGNKGLVTGKGNIQTATEYSLINDAWHKTGHELCTGTGGIAGKIYHATVSRSYNEKKVTCNFNGGGIAGINHGGTIKYCYNKGGITATEYGRVGGVVGASSNGVTIIYCYNLGKIYGSTGTGHALIKWSVLYDGIGGIIGYLKDDSFGIDGETSTSKYLQIDYKKLKFTHSQSRIYGNYNAGELESKASFVKQKHHIGGIVGSVGLAIDFTKTATMDYSLSDVNLSDNYYLDNTEYGACSTWDGVFPTITDDRAASGAKLNENEMKEKLYSKAADTYGPKVPDDEPWDNSKYIYNTIVPLDNTKGYQGYGVLWWEIGGYVRLEAYVCSGYETPAGVKKYVKIRNDHNTTFEVGGKRVILDDSFNTKRYSNGGINLDTHCWIMMINTGTHNFKAYAIDYGEAIDSGKNISRNTKLFALLRTGSDSAVLGKNGAVSYNWNVTETRNVPTRRTYKDSNKLNSELLPYDWYYTDSDYRDIDITYNAKVGNSQDNLSTSKIAKIHLGGGTLFNNARPDLEYSWNITCNGWHRVWVGRSWSNWDGYEYQRYEWTKSISEKEEYSIINSQDKGRKPTCNIVIPLESLVEKTIGKDLPFTEEDCEVTRGDLTINYTYYMDDNIISKADFTGLLGNVLDSRGTIKDNFNISANYEGVRGNFGREIQYSLYTTSDRARTEGASIKLNVKDVIGERSGNLIISTSWDAVYVGMYLEINSIDLEVEYAFVSGEAGTISYYDL